MPLLVMGLIFTKMTTSSPFFLRPIASLLASAVRSGYIQPNLDKNIRFLNAELEKSSWFAGEQFTAADIMMRYGQHLRLDIDGVCFKFEFQQYRNCVIVEGFRALVMISVFIATLCSSRPAGRMNYQM